jgi:hypothetical protein
MIKPKNSKDDQWQKNEGARCNDAQMPPLTYSWPNTRKVGPASGARKLDHPKYQIGQSGFLELGQHLYSQELVQQTIVESVMSKFRRSRFSSARLSSGALLPGWAMNA